MTATRAIKAGSERCREGHEMSAAACCCPESACDMRDLANRTDGGRRMEASCKQTTDFAAGKERPDTHTGILMRAKEDVSITRM